MEGDQPHPFGAVFDPSLLALSDPGSGFGDPERDLATHPICAGAVLTNETNRLFAELI